MNNKETIKILEETIRKLKNDSERNEFYPKGDSEHQDKEHGCCTSCGEDVGGNWSGNDGCCSKCNI